MSFLFSMCRGAVRHAGNFRNPSVSLGVFETGRIDEAGTVEKKGLDFTLWVLSCECEASEEQGEPGGRRVSVRDR